MENAETWADQLDPAILVAGNHAEDIVYVWNQGLEVNDDNEPAQENVLLPNQIKAIIN